MPISDEHFDPETLNLLSRIFDEAWHIVQTRVTLQPDDVTALRTKIAIRLIAAARDGERDPDRLRSLALRSIEG